MLWKNVECSLLNGPLNKRDGLPADGQNLQEGPTRQEPLTWHCAWKLDSSEEDCAVNQELEPGPQATAKERQPERAVGERLLYIECRKTVENESTHVPTSLEMSKTGTSREKAGAWAGDNGGDSSEKIKDVEGR
jgi:hypothetical protein